MRHLLRLLPTATSHLPLSAALALLLLACSPASGGAMLATAPSTPSIPPLTRRETTPVVVAANQVAQASPAVAAPASGASLSAPLVVDDAAAANPELAETTLQASAEFGVQSRALRLPAGFSITLLAAGLSQPRFMAFDGAGNLLVAAAGSGSIYRYPVGEGGVLRPAPQPPEPLLRGLTRPSNVAFFESGGATYLYVGETDQVSRYRYTPDGPPTDREVVIPNLPTGGHNTRTIAYGPDGKLYLAVGSSCNICDERDERRAAVLRYNLDGSGYERLAWGLRNAVGIVFQPGTSLLWATVNERDNQGNEIPPDLVTIVQQGANYGWPACLPPNARPQSSGTDCSGVTPPTIGIQAHSAPLGLAFYNGSQFPEPYQGDLFVVQHGSWNRQPPAAPKLLRIDFEGGQPVKVRDFATGWQNDAGARWGRPAGVVAAPDGSLVVSDDQAGLLYRISFGG